MKQLIVSALLSLMTGILFTLGVFGTVMVITSWEKPGGPFQGELEFVRLPQGISVVEHARVTDTPYFTIRGLVENAGPDLWTEVNVEATIKAGTAVVNECNSGLDGKFKPGDRRAFLIECYGVAGTGTPENLSYEIKIPSARK